MLKTMKLKKIFGYFLEKDIDIEESFTRTFSNFSHRLSDITSATKYILWKLVCLMCLFIGVFIFFVGVF